MPYYLNRFRYIAETWRQLVSNPVNLTQPIRRVIEQAGGKLHGFWYAFGESDGYILAEFPDNVSFAAVAALVAAGGSDEALETAVLFTPEEMVEALKRAGSLSFRPAARSEHGS